jgi:hypothetical protein
LSDPIGRKAVFLTMFLLQAVAFFCNSSGPWNLLMGSFRAGQSPKHLSQ